jgi:hypothetical protein
MGPQIKNKLRDLSPLANYTDWWTTACRRSYCQLFRKEGIAWLAQRIPTAIFSVFLVRPCGASLIFILNSPSSYRTLLQIVFKLQRYFTFTFLQLNTNIVWHVAYICHVAAAVLPPFSWSQVEYCSLVTDLWEHSRRMLLQKLSNTKQECWAFDPENRWILLYTERWGRMLSIPCTQEEVM